MISLLNGNFVPVFTSNEDYRDGGSAPAEERAALDRIFKDGYEKKLSVGSVHAYIVGTDGHTFSSLHTAEAAKPQKLIGLLEDAVAKLRPTSGQPLVKPCPPAPPECGKTSIRLNLTARYLEKKGDDYVLTIDPSGGWAAMPGVDWICVDEADWKPLLPERGATSGKSWNLPKSFTDPILTHFYPPTENNNTAKNRIETGTLQASLQGISGNVADVKIEGKLKMFHDFYHSKDGRWVEADVIGYARVDRRNSRVLSLEMTTERAEYFQPDGKSSLPFGVAVRLAN